MDRFFLIFGAIYLNGCASLPSTSPLHDAAAIGDVTQVRTLIASGSDVNQRVTSALILGECEITPLHVAAFFADEESIVRTLLQAGADVNAVARPPRGFSYLLDDSQIHCMGWTALSIASFFNDSPEIVQALLDAGANVNAPTSWMRWTPAHLAALNENPGIIEVLIEAGADINRENLTGMTPFDEAMDEGNSEVADILASAGGRAASGNTDSGGFGLGQAVAAIATGAGIAAAVTEGVPPEDAVGLGMQVLGAIEGESQPAQSVSTSSDTAVSSLPSSTGASPAQSGANGPCEIPGFYDEDSSFDPETFRVSYCPVRAFSIGVAHSLQAELMRCRLNASDVPTLPPQRVAEFQRNLRTTCERLAVLAADSGISNCRCPSNYGR